MQKRPFVAAVCVISIGDLTRLVEKEIADAIRLGYPTPTIHYHPTQDGARTIHNAMIVGYFTEHRQSEPNETP